jgi:hypothetical protein
LPPGTQELPLPILGNGFEGKFFRLQNTSGILTTFQAKVLNGVTDDADDDVNLFLIAATIATIENAEGQSVRNSFENGGKQIVEVQPPCSFIPLQADSNAELSGSCAVPEPTTIFGSVLALSVGGWLKRKKSSQQDKTKA